MAGEALGGFAARVDLEQFKPNALGLFALDLRFDIGDAFELGETVTDGGQDKKCDIFYVDEALRTAVIAQAYESQAPKDNPPVNKATDLHAAVSWLIDPASATALNPRMQSAAAELKSAIEDGDIDTIEVWFVHNSPSNKDVDSELAQVARTTKALLNTTYGEAAVGIACVAVQVSADELDNWWARRSAQILIEDLVEVPATEIVWESGPDWRAALTSVQGRWLKELHDRYTPNLLFAGNVRDFLGAGPSRSRINHGIVTTARTRPSDFWAFNNGVTALTKGFVEGPDGSLSIQGITIVNGAQTTGAISSIDPPESLRVPIRFVACSNEDLVGAIKQATNTQNQILASDFRSSDACQTRLRNEFREIPNAHYTGARRGEAVGRPASKQAILIGADQAAQALAAFHGEPHRAYHGKERIWSEDPVYDRFFSARTSAAHVVFVTSLVRAINERKSALRVQDQRGDADEDEYLFLSQRGSQYLLTAGIAHVMEIVLGQAVADPFDLSFGTQVSPAVATELWTPLLESLVAFHSSLQAAAESGRIRSEDARTTALSAFRQQVNALRKPLESIFKAFRPHVEVRKSD